MTQMPAYDDVKQLGNLLIIRHRPGTYVGDHHHNLYNSSAMNLVREVIGNSVDEFMNGHATKLVVTVNTLDNSITVVDDGRGIPYGPGIYRDEVTKTEHPADKLFLATGVANTGGKYDKGDEKAFKFAIGMNGIGIKATNALSARFDATVRRGDGKAAHIGFEKGELVDPVTVTEDAGPRGTTIRWTIDQTILPFQNDPDHVKRYLQEVAYLNAGLRIDLRVITAKGEGEHTHTDNMTFYEPDGLKALAAKMVGNDTLMVDFPLFTGEMETGSRYEIILKVTEGSGETVMAFVNGAAIETASAPVAAARQAYGRALLQRWKDSPKPKKHEKLEIKTDDIRSGLVAIVKILHVDPAFDSQTKTKLVNTDISSTIQAQLPDLIKAHLLANPAEEQKVLVQAVKMAEARMAAQKAREEVLKRNAASQANSGPISLDIYTPPLKDDPTVNDLYLFEGQSAAGALLKAAKVRDPKTGGLYKDRVGILALKGAVLNTLEKDIERAALNVELNTLIKVSGLNLADPSDLSKLKFNRFIIATDADAGGSHIATLLLAFFVTHFPEVIKQGKLSRVITPLFEVTDVKTKQIRFIYPGENRQDAVAAMGYNPADVGKTYLIKRDKGLGEMGDQAQLTLVDNPRLQSFQTDNVEDLRKLQLVFSGKDFIPTRRELIFKHGLVMEDKEAA